MAKATGFIEHNRKDRQYIDVKQRLKNLKADHTKFPH